MFSYKQCFRKLGAREGRFWQENHMFSVDK
ncbi:DUF321 domain-containing protein [Photorhabdus bodei]|uniref:DUF321 domain-containing protein n=1 Tax=Photorhabdus bodei TaxID=2029681 RepID=A0ABX0AK36_9GAMM|nr:DUF321 domain-containing protein [Photorhabdus bodei]NDL03363.1 DUF321 domain-containing protein [Photorhabdus bodei]NDL07477.1 DUF321 domain-containing protein [Photorhabdus bodei]